jgi:hypothetical protein
MKNRVVLSIFLTVFFFAVKAQSTQLIIEGSEGKFYLNHTVVAKENWYSIGRLFNAPPHDIANYNNMQFDKPLEVNTVLKIPLTAGNFDQKQIKQSGETLVPLYHVLQEKEWIFKISEIYNDVPVTSLEKWNKVKRDNVKLGTPLIVGFLKVKTDQSPLAIGIDSNPVLGPAVTENSNKTNKPTDVPAPTPASQNPSTMPSTSNAAKPATISTAAGSTASSSNAIAVSNPPERVNNYAATHSNGGFFSVDFTGTGKASSGTAGTFKSTSGWTDGKYYALMNGVPVGSIIRVSGTNNKMIYAKVLGQLPDMKESTGLLIRISNAASAELGLGEGKFPVEVKY